MKSLTQITHSRPRHWVGDGFPVRNLLSIADDARQASPFLLLDYAGPHEFAPARTPRGVGAHPLCGFETVTIVYRGEVAHRDSAGNQGVIGPGDVQWMTAAAGVLYDECHSEAFTREGGVLEMVQLWVNLPAPDKLGPPRYQNLVEAQIPVVSLPHKAGQARIIAGEHAGQRGPASTHTPMQVWDLRLHAGTHADFALPDHWTTALLVLHGEVAAGEQSVGAASLAQFSHRGDCLRLQVHKDTIALLLSGQPIDEPIAHRGPFVMNTEQELREAIDDFNSGRYGQLDG